jgi:hypothetical protein
MTSNVTIHETLAILDAEIYALPHSPRRTALRRATQAIRLARAERECGDYAAARTYLAEARHEHARAAAL